MLIRWLASLTLYCWFLVYHTEGYSSGAPNSQCSPMIPKHSRIPPQTDNIPYQLTTNPASYRPGQEIEVRLSSSQGEIHKGFLVRTETDTGGPAGTMIKVGEQKTLRCGINAGGITHSSNAAKQFTTFRWRAPDPAVGDVTFFVTVVKDYTTFWTGKNLTVISVAPETTTESEQTTVRTAAPTTREDTDQTTPTHEDQTHADSDQTDSYTTPTPQPQTTFVSTTDGSKLTTPLKVEVTTNIFTSNSTSQSHVTQSNTNLSNFTSEIPNNSLPEDTSIYGTNHTLYNEFMMTTMMPDFTFDHQAGGEANKGSNKPIWNTADTKLVMTTLFTTYATDRISKRWSPSTAAEVTEPSGASLPVNTDTSMNTNTMKIDTAGGNITDVTSDEKPTTVLVERSTITNEPKASTDTPVITNSDSKTTLSSHNPNQDKDIYLNTNKEYIPHNKEADRNATTPSTRDILRLRNRNVNFLTNMFLKPILHKLRPDSGMNQNSLEKFRSDPRIKQGTEEQAIKAFHGQTSVADEFKSQKDGKITFDPECGSSKGCFVKCDGRDCQFMVTWRDLGTAIKFEIYGRPDRNVQDAWVAVGFSTDTKMGEDSVTECVHTNGMIQAFNSYNPGYSNARLPNPQRGLSQIQGNYINGVLMCSFLREKRIWNVPQIYDLEQDWHIMYANGRALPVPAWSISMHSLSPDNYPQTSAVKVDYQSFVVVGSGAKYPLVKAHGCLMILAWVFFTGVGIVTARYYKNVWVDKSFMKLRIWFQVHRFSMVAAVLCNTLAFIIIFVEVGGYSNIPDIPGKSYLMSHPVLGIIITILSITNPVMAFFRPDPEHSKRSIFNWAHWGVGMAAYILSIISICFGFQLGKSHTPEYAIYIMIVYVIYIIMFDISLETMEIMAKRDKKGKVEQVEMSTTTTNGTDSSIPNGNTTTKGKNKKTDRTKTILLALHFAFTGAFALVLVLVVALN